MDMIIRHSKLHVIKFKEEGARKMKCSCGSEIIFDKKEGISVYQTECSCGIVYQRKSGSSSVYKTENRGDDWACVACGSEIQGADVAHSVRDGFFALSGSGRVERETVPYCPKCEKQPGFYLSLIHI